MAVLRWTLKLLGVVLSIGTLGYLMVFVRTQPTYITETNSSELNSVTRTSSNGNTELESLKEILAEVLKKRMGTSEMVASSNSTKLTGDIKIKDYTTNLPRRRILCWVMTDPKILDITAIPRDTWCNKCDLALFMSSAKSDSFPTVGLEVPAGRNHIGRKSRAAWEYIYKHHLNDFEFFLKADPDTFIIVENLRDYLSKRDPEKLEYYGHAYTPPNWNFTYMAGGPGVVLSRASVKALVEGALHNPVHNRCLSDGQGEDWKVCKCLNKVGAEPVDTRDSQGRERFFVLDIKSLMTGSFPDWYRKRDTHGSVKGVNCCSDYPIGFHYVSGVKMRELYYLIYSVKVKSIE